MRHAIIVLIIFSIYCTQNITQAAETYTKTYTYSLVWSYDGVSQYVGGGPVTTHGSDYGDWRIVEFEHDTTVKSFPVASGAEAAISGPLTSTHKITYVNRQGKTKTVTVQGNAIGNVSRQGNAFARYFEFTATYNIGPSCDCDACCSCKCECGNWDGDQCGGNVGDCDCHKCTCDACCSCKCECGNWGGDKCGGKPGDCECHKKCEACCICKCEGGECPGHKSCTGHAGDDCPGAECPGVKWPDTDVHCDCHKKDKDDGDGNGDCCEHHKKNYVAPPDIPDIKFNNPGNLDVPEFSTDKPPPFVPNLPGYENGFEVGEPPELDFPDSDLYDGPGRVEKTALTYFERQGDWELPKFKFDELYSEVLEMVKDKLPLSWIDSLKGGGSSDIDMSWTVQFSLWDQSYGPWEFDLREYVDQYTSYPIANIFRKILLFIICVFFLVVILSMVESMV